MTARSEARPRCDACGKKRQVGYALSSPDSQVMVCRACWHLAAGALSLQYVAGVGRHLRKVFRRLR